MINAYLNIFDIINVPFGWLLRQSYSFTGSYLVALVIFAVILKIVLFPLGIKQQKNSIKQAALRPKENIIRKKYAGRNDKATQQKMQQEIMQLYQEEHFSPFSGCLPLLIQMPIIFSLYNVIKNPLTYIANLNTKAITAITERSEELLGKAYSSAYGQIQSANHIISNKSDYSDILDKFNINVDAIPRFTINIFGRPENLGAIPKELGLGGFVIIILVLTFITAFLGQMVTRKFTYQPANNASAESSMRLMNVFMPLFSVYIAYIVPIAVAVYWMMQNVLNPVQQIVLSKMFPIPKLNEEDLKLAEKEYNAKNKQKPKKFTEVSKKRSLIYDDDDDDTNENNSAVKSISNSKTGTSNKEKSSKNESVIEKAPLQDDDDLHN